MPRALAYLTLTLTVLCAATTAGAQQQAAAAERQPPPALALDGASPAERVRLAVASGAYPVTAGDVYLLSYVSAGVQTSQEIVIHADYIADLGVFGELDASALTYPELRRRIEARVGRAYPQGLASLSLTAIGLFQVAIVGDVVPDVQTVRGWGLLRLSDVIRERLGPDGSRRRVGVRRPDGSVEHYDYYQARAGYLEHDPYLRPGDAVIVYPRQRVVEVTGAVQRPGRYELLDREGLEQLLDRYAAGVTERGDRSRVRVARAESPPAVRYVDLSGGYGSAPPLRPGDVVTVPDIERTLPVVVFEGAVQMAHTRPEASEQVVARSASSEAGRIVRPFLTGETLFDATYEVRNALLARADLAAAYLLRRSGEPIAVDLQRLLYDYVPGEDLVLEPGDRVVIPFRPDTVVVQGAVAAPGAYPWVPGETAGYYLGRAGGIDIERSSNGKVRITDPTGQRQTPGRPLQPGDRIFVPDTRFLFHFDRSMATAASLLSIVATVLTIITMVNG